MNDMEYDLCIRPDTNAARHRLWFYFCVTNMKAGQRTILHISNFSKTRSLYRLGMAPVVRSTSRPEWVRMDERQACYYRSAKTKKYALSFGFLFDREEEYFFAYSFPYTYTHLRRFLWAIQLLPDVKIETLCRTLMGRRLDLVSIGYGPRFIFITSRVHPGESPSSYIAHGLIQFLVSASEPMALLLRKHFTFKIVPMLNPDGVVLGNYRSSALGFDLNRYWLAGDVRFHPTLHAVRQLLVRYDRDPNIDLAMFIDIHAHSTGTNCFMYVNSHEEETQRERNMLLPRLFSLNSRDFSAASSKFCKDPLKAGTGRRAIGDFLSVKAFCYTMEVSFFCGLDSRLRTTPFTQESYLNLGRDLAITMLDFYKLR